MNHLLITVFFLIFFISLFIREVKKDNKKHQNRDRLGDEHIMREIDKLKSKEA
ncbi:hypothetical protein FNO01nite_05160 [Flavobacterium noncentrifugens]|uniref:Uncharacterized protein n=1 Tax=Flavobacterium noncentrifugens TaxID=1128970 RepID=A0A1G8SIF0_9FLAO|nr:hypothetical protein [Flavobacterium noncentrifugens]GEP49844.1 hypothetical protein FNO01nite_05160 [Flavobacterium noncentrifugens]SDJ28981.1 hypothetical protein SAMN04487935_0570 [Flavobacterium noncentrifugens]